ncbi:MAG: hypothetical protein RBT32_02345 [Methanothermobacter sp.]|nr:hypothetical protein [Methanobacteriales archaeon]MDX9692967.1 hypothetical protein [Methanothermobacter sp.]HOQ20141.1 hypothetical protein [Methanothermobacter sp.]
MVFIFVAGLLYPIFATGLWASPAEFRYDLKPGETVTGEVTVKNIGDDEVKVTVEKKRLLMDSIHLVYSDKGIANWITIDGNTTFNLKPGESRKIRFTVKAPSRINYSDAMGALVIRGLPVTQRAAGGMQVTQGVELVIPIRVGLPGPIIESLKLLDHKVPSVLLSFIPGEFVYELRNDGTVQANMTGMIEIKGLTRHSLPIDGVVYPEDNYTLVERWTPGWADIGLYKVDTRIEYGRFQKAKSIETTDTLVVIPVWLIILIIVGAVIWILRRKGVEPPIRVKIEKRK